MSNRLQQMQALLDDQDDGESEDTMTVHTTQIMVQAIELRLIRIARMLKELKPDCPNDPRIQDLTNQTLARLEQEFAAEIVPDRFYQRQHVMDRQKLERLLMVYDLLEETEHAQDTIAKLVVEPYVKELMTKANNYLQKRTVVSSQK